MAGRCISRTVSSCQTEACLIGRTLWGPTNWGACSCLGRVGHEYVVMAGQLSAEPSVCRVRCAVGRFPRGLTSAGEQGTCSLLVRWVVPGSLTKVGWPCLRARLCCCYIRMPSVRHQYTPLPTSLLHRPHVFLLPPPHLDPLRLGHPRPRQGGGQAPEESCPKVEPQPPNAR